MVGEGVGLVRIGDSAPGDVVEAYRDGRTVSGYVVHLASMVAVQPLRDGKRLGLTGDALWLEPDALVRVVTTAEQLRAGKLERGSGGEVDPLQGAA